MASLAGNRVWAERSSRTRLLVALGVLGFAARLWLAWISEGSNDIRYWLHFAQLVNVHGFGRAYVLDSWLNHPPLMTLWAALCERVAGESLLTFARLFKLPALAAEFATAVLLFYSYQARGSRSRWAAFALYAIALGNALISSFHGNTDAVYVALSFAAAFVLQETRRAWLAGLLLGLALNVKLIPVVLVLPLAALCGSPRKTLEYGLGLSTAALPYVWAFRCLAPDEQHAFISGIFGYKSYPDVWGVELVIRTLLLATKHLPLISAYIHNLRDAYYLQAGKVLVAMTGVLAGWILYRRRNPPTTYAVSAAAYSIFLLLAPSFAVQYLISVLPSFLAWRLRSGIAVGIATSVQAAMTYAQFVTSWSPLATNHTGTLDICAGLSVVTWIVIANQACKTLAIRWEPSSHGM
jgi:hypothetical protein